MIKAIIFDCFGVLTTEGWQEFKQTHFSNDSDKLQEAVKLNQLADEGKISHADLLPMIAGVAGIPSEQARREIDNYKTNTHLMDFIASSLKEHYKIGMLSNVSDDWLRNMFTSDQLALFDEIALSYKTGYTKPHPQAYTYIAKKLGVETSECVFVDDLSRNVSAAEKVSMRAIEYTGFNQFKNDLKEKLEMSDTDK
jgi:putative hydrolase of the HAD superfamily